MRAPMLSIKTNMERPVNLLRATTSCNTFYVFLSAAKAALLPFLTLFFRLLGLTSLETGVVMAAKTLTGFVWAPLWARCAVAYNKRRTVLIFSVLMMTTMYISFVGVYFKIGMHHSCMKNKGSVLNGSLVNGVGITTSSPVHVNDSDLGNDSVAEGNEHGVIAPSEQNHPQTENSGQNLTLHKNLTAMKSSPKPSISSPVLDKPSFSKSKSSFNHKGIVDKTDSISKSENSNKIANHQRKPKISVNEKGSIQKDTAEKSSTKTENGDNISTTKEVAGKASSQAEADGETFSRKDTEASSSLSDADLDELESAVKEAVGYSFKDIMDLGLSAHDIYKLAKNVAPDANLSEDTINFIFQRIKAKSYDSTGNSHAVKRSVTVLGKISEEHSIRTKRNLNVTFLNDLKERISLFTTNLENKKLLLFLIILLVIVFGEFFSSPVEKIADDAWFDFLERIDDMEKYGRQRYWGSLTFAIVPIVVTVLVDYMPCHTLFGARNFLMHFYVFGSFMIFTLLLAFYFPMPPPVKQKYSSKVCKGLRVICCDRRGCLFVITLLVAGMVYASFQNFLFWRIQDLGGGEIIMGLCVAVGAFSETPMLLFSNKLVTKLGHGGVVALSMLALAFRLLYYGFFWTPWLVLPAEITNAFTHTALWYAVLSYDEFNVGSAVDRSIRSILSSLYFGLGFSMGSLISGLAVHFYDTKILFFGASILSGVWCLLFSLFQLCMPKKERVKYIKLLRNEEDSSDGGDDWLEMALKDQ